MIDAWIQILAPLHRGCGQTDLGKSLNLSIPQISYLWHGNNNIYIIKFMKE